MILGRLSVVLVVVMAGTGFLVLTVRIEEAVRLGEPQVWLRYGPLFMLNLILFVSFYAGALYMAMRNRIQAHKRLIIVASAIPLAAGFSRLIMFLSGFHPWSLPAGVFACGLFILIGIAYDRLSRRRVHPVYWIGLVALIGAQALLMPQVNAEAVSRMNEGLAVVGKHLGFLYHPEPTVEF